MNLAARKFQMNYKLSARVYQFPLHFRFIIKSMASAVQQANPAADVVRRDQALLININAAIGLQAVVKTNLGPKGTLKM